MTLTIDDENQTLTVERGGVYRDLPLYSREAFEMLSREWVRVGWGLQYYFTFTWMGQPVLQLPEDLVRLQEVVYSLQPEAIVETGIYNGGSLLFHATLCEAMNKGRVIGIDKSIDGKTRESVTSQRLAHRISMIEGDSAAPDTISAVRAHVGNATPVMVILDSHHSREHVARELEAYSPLVTPGSCIVAADGIMRDLTDVPGGEASWVSDNPAQAAGDFAALHPEFERRQPVWKHNRSQLERNITYWPDGWLWRKS